MRLCQYGMHWCFYVPRAQQSLFEISLNLNEHVEKLFKVQFSLFPRIEIALNLQILQCWLGR